MTKLFSETTTTTVTSKPNSRILLLQESNPMLIDFSGKDLF